MTRLEACAYERIDELETEVEQLKESLNYLHQILEKIMRVAKDKSSEQWLKEHNCGGEKEKLKEEK